MSKGQEETTGLTPKKEEKFLATLAVCGNVSKSARSAKMSRQYLYRKRDEDEAFRQAWDFALYLGNQALEDEARRRSYDGWLEPVFYQGSRCGTVRKFSDTLLIVLLKAHNPEKYQDRQKLDHSSSDGSMTPVVAARSPLEVMAELRAKRDAGDGAV